MDLNKKDELYLQSKILSTDTANNPDMQFSKIPLLNKGLNPKLFSGTMTRIVNAINLAMDRAESARQYGSDLYKKFNKIILDTSSSYGRNKLNEMIEKTNQNTLIEAIISLSDKIASGEFNLTAETIIAALGYTPIKEPEYVLGIMLDMDDKVIEKETQD